MSIFLRKTVSDDADTMALQQRMAKALARLEHLLPMYWSTSTTYFLLFGPEDMAEWGAFWAINMLKVLYSCIVISEHSLILTSENKVCMI